jgi:hypothetical protein
MPDVILRGLTQRATEGRVLPSFAEALAVRDYPAPEPLITWKDTLAVVDVDFHGRDPQSFVALHRLLNRVHPRPSLCWVSHGGGFKLLYEARDHAFIARMVLRTLGLGESGIEVANRTRHPHYPRGPQTCSEVIAGCPDGDSVKRARAILFSEQTESEVDYASIDEQLAERGLARGQRYPHTDCPIDPRPNDSGGSPVDFGPEHIWCYVCQRKRSYADFLNGAPPRRFNALRSAVLNRTHWAHARHVIRHVTGCEDRNGYEALLALCHDGPLPDLQESLTRKVFFPPQPILRGTGVWLDADTYLPAAKDGLAKLVAFLPACQYVDEAKEAVKVNQNTVAKFQGTFNLADYGYATLEPLRGLDMLPRIRPFRVGETIPVVLPADPPFAYRTAPRDLAAAEQRIRDCFPTVNLDLLRLLTLAKAVLQLQEFENIPQLYLTGQSRAGKSATVLLAAELAGDAVSKPCFNENSPERFLQAYADASQEAGYALFNEAKKQFRKDSDFRAALLMFEIGRKYHHLYVGQRSILNPAVVVLTDTQIPDVLRDDEQTARRIVHVELGAGLNLTEGIDWEETCGTGQIRRWRRGDPANHLAADVFLSDVIDRFADMNGPSFGRIAKALGFPLLSENANRSRTEFLAFYRAVLSLKENQDGRHKGNGWRRFSREESSDVARLYCDLTTGDDTQTLTAARWPSIVGRPVTMELRPHRAQVYVRFLEGIGNESRPVELVTAESNSNGLGNAIDVQPESRWFDRIPSAFLNAAIVCRVPT